MKIKATKTTKETLPPRPTTLLTTSSNESSFLSTAKQRILAHKTCHSPLETSQSCYGEGGGEMDKNLQMQIKQKINQNDQQEKLADTYKCHI